jgi:hemolysin D
MKFAKSAKLSERVIRFPSAKGGDEAAFLLAALEIVETPPSPVGRILAYIVIGIFCVALGWATFGTVDIVAIAPGKIVPSGRTKVIQPYETGVVRAIHVHDGQSVHAGDSLIELDSTMTDAELKHLKSDLMASRLEVARLRAVVDGKDDPLAAFRPPAGASAADIDRTRRFLLSQTAEQEAKVREIKKQQAQREAERATIKATVNKLNEIIPLLQKRVDVRKHLTDRELGSRIQYLADLQELVGQQQDVLVQESRYQEADAAIAALVETRTRVTSEYQRQQFDDLGKAEQKAAGLTQDVIKAGQRIRFQDLTAPVDGTVQQLAIHTVGGVVTPAQALMVIVPQDIHLEIEAMVANRDIGFVEPGQDVAVKIDTFNFTRYGLLHGRVLNVSSDAIAHDTPTKAADRADGSEGRGSEPKGQELVYAAHVSLDRTHMQVDSKLVNLAPGMAVTVEIKTGTRRIISYLLSPLLRYNQESLRER